MDLFALHIFAFESAQAPVDYSAYGLRVALARRTRVQI
jgi:hypothetical protein